MKRHNKLASLRLFLVVLLGIVPALLLSPRSAFAGPDTWTNYLSSGPTFNIPNLGNPPTSVLSSTFYYSPQVFTVSETRTYAIQSTGDIWDPAHTTSGAELILYQGTFDPSNPLTNALEAVGGNGQYPTITRTLTAGVDYTLVTSSWAAYGTGPYTITVSPVMPKLTVNNVTATEGDSGTTTFSFTVNLSMPAEGSGVTFDITTANGTATAASGDYVAKSLTGQTIAVGSSSYTFNVTVNGDSVIEDNETFFVNVTNVTGANVTDGQGQGTITNDDTTSVSIDDVTHAEGDSGTTTFRFTVSLSNPAGPGGVSFNIATADGTATTADNDYTAQSLTGQSIPAGSSSYTFDVAVIGDTIWEVDETFVVNIRNVSGIGASLADGQGQGTIVNDDPVALSIDDVTQNEGDSGTTTFSFTASLSAPADPGGVTFDIATADGTATTADNDYTSKSLAAQTIPAGSSTYTFDVTVNGDTVVEADETFLVNITNVTGASLADGQGQGTIVNDDFIALSIDNVTQNEGDSGTTTFSFTVSLSAPAEAGGVTFDIGTADDTATTADNDYIPKSLAAQTIPAGSSTYTFDVLVNGDTAVEDNETFLVNISNLSGLGIIISDGQGQGTITNDDSTTVSIDDVALAEGNSGTTTFSFTVSLSVPAGPGGVAFDIATADGTATTAGGDYVAHSLTGQTISAGSASYTFDVAVNGDGVIENDETFLVNVSNVSGTSVIVADGQGQGTITNDDSTTLSINDVTQAEGDSGSTTFSFTVSLSVPAGPGGVTFDITTADGTATTANNDYVAKTLTGQLIPAGSSSYVFDVAVNSDGAVEPDETFNVNVSNVAGLDVSVTDGQGLGTITNDDAAGISVSAITGDTTEAGGTATFTVVLTSQPTADVSVAFTGVDATEGSLSPTGLTFTSTDWNAVQTVTVTGVDDGIIDGNITYTVTATTSSAGDASYNAGLTGSVQITNLDNDTLPVADDDTYATNESQPLIVDAANGVLNGDTGGNGTPFTAVQESSPTNGILVLNGDGSFVYTPNFGYVGMDNFTYHATDGINDSNIATVTIAVALVNGDTRANDDGAEIGVNGTITVDVLANDVDQDGDPLHIAGVSQPAHGQATVENGQIVYTPDAGFVGTDMFSYTAADAFGGSDTATVVITVWQPVPLCADFDGSTNTIIRADVPDSTVTDGSVFCRVLVENSTFVRQSAEVGKPEVLSRGVIQAIDAFALHYDGTSTAFFNNPVTVCLQGQGALLYLDATLAPRTVVELPVFTRDGYTCTAIPQAGTVVLVSGAASVTNPAPAVVGPTIALTDCMVTTRDILNLRAEPGANGAILRMIPYDVTLTALQRANGWFYVDYLGERGWISAGYVTPQGACGQ